MILRNLGKVLLWCVVCVVTIILSRLIEGWWPMMNAKWMQGYICAYATLQLWPGLFLLTRERSSDSGART